jgi:hypothetical protein
MEPVANHLEQAKLVLDRLAVGRGDVAGERVGRLAERCRQRLRDHVERRVETILLAEQLGAFLPDLVDAIALEGGEDGQRSHQPAHHLELGIGHVPFRRRDQDHRVDQRGVVVDAARLPVVLLFSHPLDPPRFRRLAEIHAGGGGKTQ